MSADNIATCPKCGENSLREYLEDWGITKNLLNYSYRSRCPECGFSYEYTLSPIEIHP